MSGSSHCDLQHEKYEKEEEEEEEKEEVGKKQRIWPWQRWGECMKCSGERKRFRHILVYPAEGGRECAPADVEEVGRCPNPCAEDEQFCEWHEWSTWGSCSMSCGPGGKRKRSRSMKEVMRTPKPNTPAAIAAANAAKAAAKAAKASAPSAELLEKYRSLYARTRHLENGDHSGLFLWLLGALGHCRLSAPCAAKPRRRGGRAKRHGGARSFGLRETFPGGSLRLRLHQDLAEPAVSHRI
eukprot:s4860_g3.t1